MSSHTVATMTPEEEIGWMERMTLGVIHESQLHSAPIPHGTPHGYSYHKCRCAECTAAATARAMRRYRANPLPWKAANKRYAAKNPEKVREWAREYRLRHREEVNARARARYWAKKAGEA